MSDRTADLITLWLIVLIYPLVGIAKLSFVWVMSRYTPKQTLVGKWIMRMFTSVGVSFILMGAIYALTLISRYDLWQASSAVRMVMRIALVLPALISLLATILLWRQLRPILAAIEALAIKEADDLRISDLLHEMQREKAENP